MRIAPLTKPTAKPGSQPSLGSIPRPPPAAADTFAPARAPGRPSSGQIGWLHAIMTSGNADFHTAYAAAAAGDSPLPADAGDCVYLLVPGLFGKQLPDYMVKNASALRERGLETHDLMREDGYDTAASVESNA